MTEKEKYNYDGEFEEGNKEGEKQWYTTRKRLLEKHGFDVEAWDNGELELDV